MNEEERKIEESAIFALLQRGMKDRHAYAIVYIVSLNSELFDAFERYAKDELEITE